MTDWWDAAPAERYWCEVTDRHDIGVNLRCPQKDDNDADYWGYSLINEVAVGDIVFHYFSPDRAFVGASVASGHVEERPLDWTPHRSTSRKRKAAKRVGRAGWFMPLKGHLVAAHPLKMSDLQADRVWLEKWMDDRGGTGLKVPVQRYPRHLRAAQCYLAKMPAEWVERWPALAKLADGVADVQDILSPADDDYSAGPQDAQFKPKPDAPYEALVKGGVQRRTRHHERLVREVGEFLVKRKAVVSTPHPIDLVMSTPVDVLFEAKIVRTHAGAAVREAVGQLHEYRYFLRPDSRQLCILLDRQPQDDVVMYVEEHLNLCLCWWSDGSLSAGPRTRVALAAVLGGFQSQ